MGKVVSKVDKGAVSVTSPVTGCMLEADTEDKAVVVDEVNTLVVIGESEGVTEDMTWEVAAVSVRTDAVGWLGVGIRVVVVRSGSVEVATVGVGVDLVVV